ncbi:MAG TPA: type II secretion system protein [Patescibacteria group bacterium]|nr:type II secretion system protein [Patescibacteria group bacterium]
MRKQKTRGFTLLEILIVASIIMLLAVAGVVSYSSLNRSSRDARRKSDIEQMRAAFEQWRSDYGSYPSVTVDCSVTSGLVSGSITYLATIPKDPQCTTRSYYYVTAAKADYVIAAALEIPPSPASCVSLPGGISVVGQCDDPGSTTPINCNYCVGPYGVR